MNILPRTPEDYIKSNRPHMTKEEYIEAMEAKGFRFKDEVEPVAEQPQQPLEDYLKSCNDREYAEYIIATMIHGNSPADFDRIQKEAIQAIRSRPAPSPSASETLQAYRNGFDEGFEIGKAQCETHHDDMKSEAADNAREDVLPTQEELKAIKAAVCFAIQSRIEGYELADNYYHKLKSLRIKGGEQ